MTGRLDATVDGRPVTLQTAGNTLTVRTDSWRDAWSLRRTAKGMAAAPLPIGRLLGEGLRIELVVGGRDPLTIGSNSPWWMRWLLPRVFRSG